MENNYLTKIMRRHGEFIRKFEENWDPKYLTKKR